MAGRARVTAAIDDATAAAVNAYLDTCMTPMRWRSGGLAGHAGLVSRCPMASDGMIDEMVSGVPPVSMGRRRLGAVCVDPDQGRVRVFDGEVLEMPVEALVHLQREGVASVQDAGLTTVVWDKGVAGAAGVATELVVDLVGEKALERAVARPALRQRWRPGRRKGRRR